MYRDEDKKRKNFNIEPIKVKAYYDDSDIFGKDSHLISITGNGSQYHTLALTLEELTLLNEEITNHLENK